MREREQSQQPMHQGSPLLQYHTDLSIFSADARGRQRVLLPRHILELESPKRRVNLACNRFIISSFISSQISGHMKREKKEVMKRLQLSKTGGNETVTPGMSEIESSETVKADYTTNYVPMAPIHVGIPQFNHHDREKQVADMQSIVTTPFTWPMHVFS
ncbi:hypothetical protein ACFX15_023990 [Malus domestica]